MSNIELDILINKYSLSRRKLYEINIRFSFSFFVFIRLEFNTDTIVTVLICKILYGIKTPRLLDSVDSNLLKTQSHIKPALIWLSEVLPIELAWKKIYYFYKATQQSAKLRNIVNLIIGL